MGDFVVLIIIVLAVIVRPLLKKIGKAMSEQAGPGQPRKPAHEASPNEIREFLQSIGTGQPRVQRQYRQRQFPSFAGDHLLRTVGFYPVLYPKTLRRRVAEPGAQGLRQWVSRLQLGLHTLQSGGTTN